MLQEEVTYARAPVRTQLSSVMLLGNSILRHGTARQQAAFLPLIRAGRLHFCLGYSEPEAGSDLASLKTRAQRSGDDGGWVINGQKLWTTGGHLASHVWLATRTDPDASPRHAGITVFLVPMDTPGITIQQHRALSGEVSCTVFYDDVRVPDSARVGEVNGGWKVITDALAGERVVMGGIAASMLRQLDDVLAWVRADPVGRAGPRGSAVRAKLGELAVTLQANRALVAAAIAATASGRGARLEAPMAGVLGGELAETFGQTLLDIIGRPGPRGACCAGRRRVRVRAAALDHVRGRRRHQRHTARSDRPRAGAAAMITADRLASLFRPSRIALVGASDKSTFSMLAYRNLVDFGFADHTYLVNRRGAVTHGQPTVTSCKEIGEPVDVAFLMVSAGRDAGGIDDAAAAGIRNAVVLSAGDGEAGESGRTAQAELVARAESLGMILLGPNHLGFANLTDGVPVCSIPGLPKVPGPVALLSQSGASSSAMIEFAGMANVGLSLMVTLGNEAMITAGHVLDLLVDDPGTRAVAIFMETIREPEVFRRAARRAAAAGKASSCSRPAAVRCPPAPRPRIPVRSSATTASSTRLRQPGRDPGRLDRGHADHRGRRGRRRTAGTARPRHRLDLRRACDIVADRAADLGAALPELAPRTQQALGEVMPDYGTVQNPLDLTGAAIIDPSIFTRSIEAISADPSVGVVGVIARLGDLAVALGESLESLEVNPLLVRGPRSRPSTSVDLDQEGLEELRMRTAFTDLVGVEHPIVGFNRSPGWWPRSPTPAVSACWPPPPTPRPSSTPSSPGSTSRWRGGPTGSTCSCRRSSLPRPGRHHREPARRVPREQGDSRFVGRDLLAEVRRPARAPQAPTRSEVWPPSAGRRPRAADVGFSHLIALIADALGTPPPGPVTRAKREGVAVAALVGRPSTRSASSPRASTC